MNANSDEQSKWFVGWDWAKAKHQISVLDESGQEVEKWTAAHTAEGLRQAVDRLAKRQASGQVLVAIETPHGLFVEALLEARITLYVVNPKVSKRLREALVGESKNDEREAWALGEALRLHHARWKPLAREDDLTRKLQVLTRDEQGFIAQMNQLTNQLQHALGQYYPQALELFSDWTSPTCPPCGEQLGFCFAIPNAAGIPGGDLAQAPELSPRASFGQARAVGGVEENS